MQAADISPSHVSQLVGALLCALKMLPVQFPVEARVGGNWSMPPPPEVNDEDLKIK